MKLLIAMLLCFSSLSQPFYIYSTSICFRKLGCICKFSNVEHSPSSSLYFGDTCAYGFIGIETIKSSNLFACSSKKECYCGEATWKENAKYCFRNKIFTNNYLTEKPKSDFKEVNQEFLNNLIKSVKDYGPNYKLSNVPASAPDVSTFYYPDEITYDGTNFGFYDYNGNCSKDKDLKKVLARHELEFVKCDPKKAIKSLI